MATTNSDGAVKRPNKSVASLIAIALAASVFLLVGGATTYFAYSFFDRAGRVFAERAKIRADIANLEQLRKKSGDIQLAPPDRETLARLNERYRALSEAIGLQKQLKLAARAVEVLQGEFEAEFGRRVKFSPGPPPTYDAGPPPQIPGPDSIVPLIHATIGGGRTHIKLAKWNTAAEACRVYNTFSNAFSTNTVDAPVPSATSTPDGVSTADTLIQTLDAELDGVRKNRSILDTLPAEVPVELEKLHKRLRTSWWVLTAFAIMDLGACITSVPLLLFAFGRVALLTRRVRPRRLLAR